MSNRPRSKASLRAAGARAKATGATRSMSSSLGTSPSKSHTRYYTSPAEQVADDIIGQHGLVAQGLSLEELLGAIGFPRKGNIVEVLRKKVQSEYGDDLFAPLPLPDGTVQNVAIDEKKFKTVELRLTTVLSKLRTEMEHLTIGSLGGFGKLSTDESVVVVLDLTSMDPVNCGAYKRAISALITEQLQHTRGFNILRVEGYVHNQLFNGVADSAPEQDHKGDFLPVQLERVHQATSWADNLVALSVNETPDLPDCLQCAFEDNNASSVLLVTDGPRSATTQRDVSTMVQKCLKDKQGRRLHTVAFGIKQQSTVNFLKTIAARSQGYFHRFTGNTDDIADNTGIGSSSCDNVGVRRLAQEISLCSGNLGMLRALQVETSQARKRPQVSAENAGSMTIERWLKKNGNEAKKLSLYHLLRPCAFKHVLDDQAFIKPGVPGVVKVKTVHAAVCEGQIHYRWRNGAIVHVYVTSRQSEDFDRRAKKQIELYQSKLRKFQTGTRTLFGELTAPAVTFVIASGESMKGRWKDACRKLKAVIGEQVAGARRFNIVTYGEAAQGWQVATVEANERNVQAAKEWLDLTQPSGVTTLAVGLDYALQDVDTKALYVISDGMHHLEPEASELLDQVATVVRDRSVTVSTISYCCLDRVANQFLHDLAVVGNGGFQYFTENLSSEPMSPEHLALLGPPPRGDNTDVTLLNQEIASLQEEMEKVAALRRECDTHDRLRSRGQHSEIKYEITEPPPPPPPPATKKGLATQLITADQIRLGRSLQKQEKPDWEKYSQTGATLFGAQTKLGSSSETPKNNSNTFKPAVNTTKTNTFADTRYDSFAVNEDASKTANLSQNASLVSNGLRTSKRSHYTTQRWEDVTKDISEHESQSVCTKTNREEPQVAQRSKFSFVDLKKKDDTKKKSKKKDESWTPEHLRAIPLKPTAASVDWLKDYSLDSLHLTIADALSSTAIKRRGKVVAIGGEQKTIYGKVFEEAFNVAYILRRKADVESIKPNDDQLEHVDSTENSDALKVLATQRGSIPYVVKTVKGGEDKDSVSRHAPGEDLIYVFPGAADLNAYLDKLVIVLDVYRTRLIELLNLEKDAGVHGPFTIENVDAKVVDTLHPSQLYRLSTSIEEMCNEIRCGLDYKHQAIQLLEEPPDESAHDDALHQTKTNRVPRFVRTDQPRKPISKRSSQHQDPTDFSTYKAFEQDYKLKANTYSGLPGERNKNNRLITTGDRTTMVSVGKVNPMFFQGLISRRANRKKLIHQAYGTTFPKPRASGRTKSMTRSTLSKTLPRTDWGTGDVVLAPLNGGAAFGLAKTLRRGNSKNGHRGQILVKFMTGFNEEWVPESNVLALPSLPLPLLQAQDRVLVPGAAGDNEYIPGSVLMVDTNMLAVQTINRKILKLPRAKVLKISDSTFRKAVQGWDVDSFLHASRNNDDDNDQYDANFVAVDNNSSHDYEACIISNGVKNMNFNNHYSSSFENKNGLNAGRSIPYQPERVRQEDPNAERHGERPGNPDHFDPRSHSTATASNFTHNQQNHSNQLNDWRNNDQAEQFRQGTGSGRYSRGSGHTSQYDSHTEKVMASQDLLQHTDDGDDSVVPIGNGQPSKNHTNSRIEAPPSLQHTSDRNNIGTVSPERVLVRWNKDGWFYPSILINESMSQCTVADEISGERTLVSSSDVMKLVANTRLKVGDFVLAEHVLYRDSYAPATVVLVDRNGFADVNFYDGVSSCLSPSDLLVNLDSMLYEAVLQKIHSIEDMWIGRSVIFRDNSSGYFRRGVVTARISSGARYRISPSSGSREEVQQEKSHMFTKDSDLCDTVQLEPGDGVIIESAGPGTVVYHHENGDVDVDLWNGERRITSQEECFHCGVEYVLSASAYIQSVGT